MLGQGQAQPGFDRKRQPHLPFNSMSAWFPSPSRAAYGPHAGKTPTRTCPRHTSISARMPRTLGKRLRAGKRGRDV
jgi:hypothetical protein